MDTLAIADREAKQEAAHAGLQRASREVGGRARRRDRRPRGVAGRAVAAVPAAGAGEPPKRNVWWRFLAAAFVVVAVDGGRDLDRVPALPHGHRQAH